MLLSGTVTTVPTLVLVRSGGLLSDLLVESERLREISNRRRSPSLICGVISRLVPASYDWY